jgi:hypothetical protein
MRVYHYPDYTKFAFETEKDAIACFDKLPPDVKARSLIYGNGFGVRCNLITEKK